MGSPRKRKKHRLFLPREYVDLYLAGDAYAGRQRLAGLARVAADDAQVKSDATALLTSVSRGSSAPSRSPCPSSIVAAPLAAPVAVAGAVASCACEC